MNRSLIHDGLSDALCYGKPKTLTIRNGSVYATSYTGCGPYLREMLKMYAFIHRFEYFEEWSNCFSIESLNTFISPKLVSCFCWNLKCFVGCAHAIKSMFGGMWADIKPEIYKYFGPLVVKHFVATEYHRYTWNDRPFLFLGGRLKLYKEPKIRPQRDKTIYELCWDSVVNAEHYYDITVKSDEVRDNVKITLNNPSFPSSYEYVQTYFLSVEM